jgi:hypothetical protein
MEYKESTSQRRLNILYTYITVESIHFPAAILLALYFVMFELARVNSSRENNNNKIMLIYANVFMLIYANVFIRYKFMQIFSIFHFVKAFNSSHES